MKWSAIETVGPACEEWLRTFLELPNGLPSDDTIRRVFRLFERQQFADGLFTWTRASNQALGGKVIPIDGETMRHSFRKSAGLGPLHWVTA